MSALSDALTAFQKNLSKINLSKGVVSPKVLDSALVQARQMLSKGVEKITTAKLAKDRVGKGAYPMGSAPGGGTIYSDGSVKYPFPFGKEGGPLEQADAQILKQNLLSQMPFTPQMAKMIQDTPFIAYGSTNQSIPFWSHTGGVAGDGTVGVNVQTLQQANTPWPIEVALHESLHTADDSNFNYSTGVANSMGFAKNLQKNQPEAYGQIYDRMYGKGPALYNPKNQQSQNTEMFAYYGDRGPEAVNQGNPRVSAAYAKVFAPMSKAPLNYSPRYPSANTMNYINRLIQANRIKNFHIGESNEEE